MASSLTRLGQYCRDLRSSQDKTLGDQADALGYQPCEISSIEMGVSAPPSQYPQKLIHWLQLNEQEQRELLKRLETNVVAFSRRGIGGPRTSSMRLFRKISKMRPSDIRGFGRKSAPEATKDGRD